MRSRGGSGVYRTGTQRYPHALAWSWLASIAPKPRHLLSTLQENPAPPAHSSVLCPVQDCVCILHCFHCNNTSQSSHCHLTLLILCSPRQKLATILPVPRLLSLTKQFSAFPLWIHHFGAILPRSLYSWDRVHQSQAFIPASSPSALPLRLPLTLLLQAQQSRIAAPMTPQLSASSLKGAHLCPAMGHFLLRQLHTTNHGHKTLPFAIEAALSADGPQAGEQGELQPLHQQGK